MSALAHFFEDEGLSTTGISLVREHTEGYRPPRFLWVPFPLGRPFGAPGDAAFQRRVLLAALDLLTRDDGPVILEDFPDDAPAVAAADEVEDGWVCPVSFPAPPDDERDLARALKDEVDELAPWYELSRSRRGRTTVGLTGTSPSAVAGFIAGFLDPGTPALLHHGQSLAGNVKIACEDLKAYYLEAATARPGKVSPGEVSAWFWNETAAAKVMRAMQPVLAASDDPDLQRLASDYLIPRVQAQA